MKKISALSLFMFLTIFLSGFVSGQQKPVTGEIKLMIIPITLGTGKRMFDGGTIPAS